MKRKLLNRSGALHIKANMEPDLLINGLKNYNRTNPSPLYFNASPLPITDTLRKFNLSIFQPASNVQNPRSK